MLEGKRGNYGCASTVNEPEGQYYKAVHCRGHETVELRSPNKL